MLSSLSDILNHKCFRLESVVVESLVLRPFGRRDSTRCAALRSRVQMGVEPPYVKGGACFLAELGSELAGDCSTPASHLQSLNITCPALFQLQSRSRRYLNCYTYTTLWKDRHHV